VGIHPPVSVAAPLMDTELCMISMQCLVFRLGVSETLLFFSNRIDERICNSESRCVFHISCKFNLLWLLNYAFVLLGVQLKIVDFSTNGLVYFQL
jgi:hypothetical protein